MAADSGGGAPSALTTGYRTVRLPAYIDPMPKIGNAHAGGVLDISRW